MSNDLKNILLDALKSKGISIPKFSKETGIPKDRIYKWYQQGSQPKAEDALIIEDWIKKSNIPREKSLNGHDSIKHNTLSNQSELIESLQNQIKAQADTILHERQTQQAEIKRLESHCNLLQRTIDENLKQLQANLETGLRNQGIIARIVKVHVVASAKHFAGPDKQAVLQAVQELGNLIFSPQL